MRQSSVTLVTNGDMSGNIVSLGVNLISIYAYSIQGVWTGGTFPTGVFTLQGSNDPGDNGSGQGVSQPTNWTTITNSSQVISGTPGSILYDVTECSYRWVRLVYTAGTGSGTLQAQMNTKGV
jgi:hypothetical protein